MTVFFLACEQKENCCTTIDVGVSVFLENRAGQNLFLNTIPNAIDPAAIRLVYLVEGEEKIFFMGNLDCPTNVCYVSDIGSERVTISPNDTEREAYPITYIKWTISDTDTMRCHFVRRNNNSFINCDSVWMNGKLMFPDQALPDFGRAFKMIK